MYNEKLIYHINSKEVDYETFTFVLVAQIVDYYGYDVVYEPTNVQEEYFEKKLLEVLETVEKFGETESIGRYDFWAERVDDVVH